MNLPQNEHRPTTIGELRKALDDLGLPDDTPLVTNMAVPPNGNYIGFVIVAPRRVTKVEVPDGAWKHYSRAEEGLVTALYVA